MPSTITHAYLAKDVYKKLDQKIKTKFTLDYLEKYKTYSQGPDIFYFYNMVFPITKKSRDIIKLGSYIHNNKVNELFINLTEKVKETKNVDQFVFLSGLITHYISDSIMHSFINYKASLLIKKNLTNKDNHFIMETYLDNYLIKKYEKDNYKKFKVHKFCFNIEKNKEVLNLINDSFIEVFKRANMGKVYFKSLKDMKYFFYLFRYDPVSIKKYFYLIVNPITNKLFRDVRYLSYNFPLNQDDFYLNLENKEWCNLNNKDIISNLSFFDLYDEVIEKAKNKIELLYKYIYENQELDLNALFENKSYGTGLIIE